MKISSVIRRISYAALFFILGIVAVFLYPFPVSEPNITVEVIYVRYACGECFVQHRIIKVSQSRASGAQESIDRYSRNDENESNNPIRFIGWDILVFYKGDDEAISRYLDAHLDTSGDCMAPTFKLTGQLKRRLIYSLLYNGDRYDGIYFDANSGTAINTDPTCKGVPKEVALP
ncbi:MAG: hypothetical protein LBV49_04430 [Azonexus sp.]|jgi:hypothetical protein|nr:hypothetical protein [Azonexus sp.]